LVGVVGVVGVVAVVAVVVVGSRFRLDICRWVKVFGFKQGTTQTYCQINCLIALKAGLHQLVSC
jgi:hypothetical protein